MYVLDASVIVSLLVSEPASDAVDQWVSAVDRDDLAISDWALTEVVSALGIKVRTNQIGVSLASRIAVDLEHTADRIGRLFVVEADDLRAARHMMADWDLGLRTGDAVHLASSGRRGAVLSTRDARLLDAARKLDLTAVNPAP